MRIPVKKKLTIVFLITCFILRASYCKSQNINKNYDEKLAKELNADDYGMKKYVLVVLKSGGVTNLPKLKLDSIFSGHMANINKLASDGKLVVAGPMGKNDKSYRGIFIFDVETVAEAKKLVSTDPTIATGVLDAEYYSWYGSAA